MSVQYLKVLSSFRNATPQALLTTDEHLNALEQTWDIQATSRLLGGSSAASMVEDVHNMPSVKLSIHFLLVTLERTSTTLLFPRTRLLLHRRSCM